MSSEDERETAEDIVVLLGADRGGVKNGLLVDICCFHRVLEEGTDGVSGVDRLESEIIQDPVDAEREVPEHQKCLFTL